jgi:hypothetical protein
MDKVRWLLVLSFEFWVVSFEWLEVKLNDYTMICVTTIIFRCVTCFIPLCGALVRSEVYSPLCKSHYRMQVF